MHNRHLRYFGDMPSHLIRDFEAEPMLYDTSRLMIKAIDLKIGFLLT